MEYTQEQVKQKLESLPKDIKEAISSVDTTAKIIEISDKHKLHTDQMGMLVDETGLVMLGFKKSDDFVSNIRKRLDIPRGMAESIVREINEQIFLKIRFSLRKMHEEKETEKVEEEKKEELKKKPIITQVVEDFVKKEVPEPQPEPQTQSSLQQKSLEQQEIKEIQKTSEVLEQKSKIAPTEFADIKREQGIIRPTFEITKQEIERKKILNDIENPLDIKKDNGFDKIKPVSEEKIKPTEANPEQTQNNTNPSAFASSSERGNPASSLQAENKEPLETKKEIKPEIIETKPLNGLQEEINKEIGLEKPSEPLKTDIKKNEINNSVKTSVIGGSEFGGLQKEVKREISIESKKTNIIESKLSGVVKTPTIEKDISKDFVLPEEVKIKEINETKEDTKKSPITDPYREPIE